MHKRLNDKMLQVSAFAAKATQGLLQKTHPLQAKWIRIDSAPLPRSSHTLSVVAGRAYIFGGEINPREPVDNDMHVITLPSGSVTSADYRSVPAKPELAGGQVPEKRVGHTAAVIGERIFVFGGRGGKEMKPLEENGRVWVYNTRLDTWSYIDPEPNTPHPAARSYHTSVSIDQPQPSSMKPVKVDQARELPRTGEIAQHAQSEAQKGFGTFFVHAGCPASGRTNDLWAFDVHSRTWKELPSAPGNPRGGTSLTVSKNRIFRYGGFNGKDEEGGKLDVLELALQMFNDMSGLEPVGITTKGGWSTLDFTEEDMRCPGHRSVAGFQTITTGMGREYLVLFLGEKEPSSDGHNAAGNFWSDVWVFQAPPKGMTGASVKDATWQALGKETGEGVWSQVFVSDAEGEEGEDVKNLTPTPRGWFSSSVLTDMGTTGLLLWGGLNAKNDRLGDGWILSFD